MKMQDLLGDISEKEIVVWDAHPDGGLTELDIGAGVPTENGHYLYTEAAWEEMDSDIPHVSEEEYKKGL